MVMSVPAPVPEVSPRCLVSRRADRVVLRSRRPDGFTFVELIVTMLVITVAALAVAQGLAMGTRHSADSLLHEKSIILAQAYLDEIRAARYAENTPAGGVPPCSACGAIGAEGESRAEFDDVDDYDGLAESPPLNRQGVAIVGYERYTVAVDVDYAAPAQVTAWGLNSQQDAKVVQVTVTTPGGSSYLFPTVVANF
ncbi:MAG: prepilin-type N-terminal cleavage/methylation domain-containing protein [Pseudomonadota bacterium]